MLHTLRLLFCAPRYLNFGKFMLEKPISWAENYNSVDKIASINVLIDDLYT